MNARSRTRRGWVRRSIWIAWIALTVLPWTAPVMSGPLRHAQNAAPGAGRIGVVVRLDAPSVVDVYAAQQAAGSVTAADLAAATQAQLAAVEQTQQAFLAQLAGHDAQLIYRVQRVYNGVAVRVPADTLTDLAALPGVRSIHPLIPKTPDNSRAVPRIGAWNAWQAASALTGDGVTLAVIDTGIDYLHTMFGGSGMGYANNDLTQVGDATDFPGAKVIGGFDFAGDSYNADARSARFQPIPEPDPDPMDCHGHGTHVAGSAAGYGVTATGETYHGVYPPAPALSIGPGAAPHARLYALKVFGCRGSSELVDQAIEWAIDPDGNGDFGDRVDVINLSLGSPFGAVDDLSAEAAEAAAKTGVVVVASAGNSGDLFYAVSSPSVANAVISVAASTLPEWTAERLAEFSSRGPRRGSGGIKPDLTAPGDSIRSARAGTGSDWASASGTSMSAGLVSGALALLRQAHPAHPQIGPGWTAAELKALVMNTALPLTNDQGHSYSPTRAGAGFIALERALASQVIAYNAADPDQVSINFGAPEVLDRHWAVAAVRVANKGSTAITLTVGYSATSDLPGAVLMVETGRVLTLPPGGLATTPLTLTVDAAALRHLPEPALSQDALAPRSWPAEMSGYVTLTPPAGQGGQPELRVPVYVAPQPIAQFQAVPAALEFGTAVRATAWITHTGVGPAPDLAAGAPPTLPVALGGVFTLQQRSAPITHAPDGTPSQGRYAHADLAAVGMALRPAATSLPKTLAFALATYGAWSTPHEVRFFVLFDLNLDGVADLRLINSDAVAWRMGESGDSDAFIAALVDLRSGEIAPQLALNGYPADQADTRLFNSRVMVLPMSVADFERAGGARQFAYAVESYSEDIANALPLGLAVDRTPWIWVDLDAPGLAAAAAGNALPLVAIRPDDEVQIDFVAAGLAADQGLLVVYPYNAVERQVMMIPVGLRRNYHLPWVPAP